MNENWSKKDVFVSPCEIEAVIQSLEISKFEDLGTLGWLEKHGKVGKLVIHVMEAGGDGEERVKDLFITLGKLKILVHDVILLEIWREQFLPSLFKKEKEEAKGDGNSCSFTIYTILYHEATCITLLELLLFHPESAESLSDLVLDLTDYSNRTLNLLAGGNIGRRFSHKDEHAKCLTDDFWSKCDHIRLGIAFKSLAILRYIIENLERIDTGVLPRLIKSTDTPMLLIHLLLEKPWRRRDPGRGGEEEWDPVGNGWMKIEPKNRLLIGKIEAQAWLGIYQLLLNQKVLSSYEITDFRKSQLLKLQSFLHEATLDQIPVLVDFQRWLNQLSVASTPSTASSSSSLIIEMLPPVRSILESELCVEGRKEKLLKLYREELINLSQEKMGEKAKKLSAVYDSASLLFQMLQI